MIFAIWQWWFDLVHDEIVDQADRLGLPCICWRCYRSTLSEYGL